MEEEPEIMITYNFVHLVLLASGGRMRGRTKLQKTVYFVGALTNRLETLGFRAHYYGPYSSDVSGALDELRGLGFLTQNVSTGSSYDSKGFEMARYDFALTEAGTLVGEEKSSIHRDEWKQIKEAVNKLAKANAEDYVKLSIAAKSFFMQKENKRVIPAEELSRMSSEFGWAVTPEQFEEADQLLASINLPMQESCR